jgi:hypothetical protein
MVDLKDPESKLFMSAAHDPTSFDPVENLIPPGMIIPPGMGLDIGGLVRISNITTVPVVIAALEMWAKE